MAIEEVAAEHPEKIIKVLIDPVTGSQSFHGRKLAFGLGLSKETIGAFTKLIGNLYRLLMEKDASLVEINPLVLTAEGGFIALDGKMSFDDNGLFRHEDVRGSAISTRRTSDPGIGHNLNYVKLDGTIGCMVNGFASQRQTLSNWPGRAGELPRRGRRR
jgi:succinyl-CoA synthetase beta subunit